MQGEALFIRMAGGGVCEESKGFLEAVELSERLILPPNLKIYLNRNSNDEVAMLWMLRRRKMWVPFVFLQTRT